MYLSPVNFQTKIFINNSAEQKYNTNFKGLGKSAKFSLGTLFSAISIPLLKQDTFDKAEDASCTDDSNSVKEYYYGNKTTKEAQPEHHPDFYELKKKYDILASSYFRRGGCYGSPSDEFIDIIHSLKIFFNQYTLPYLKNNKVKMIVGGIGESQEPYSLLATVKSLAREEELKNILDMYTVDLQGKPSEDNLFKQSYYDNWGEPMFVASSFIKDDGSKYNLPGYKKYRVSDDIFEYLQNTYNNPEKAKWQTKIQDALKEYPDEEFDIISINNTLGYILDKNELIEAVNNIFRTLKPGGIFISDNRLSLYSEIFTPENSIRIHTGIYKKL